MSTATKTRQPAATRKPSHPAETIGPIALRDISPSPANPRKTFHGVEGLADSIRTHGLLEDLLVRPMGEKAHYVDGRGWLDVDYFELIDGERRYRAAKLAGLTKVQCKVRVMTDDQAAVARLISFDQKEGLPPSEHAAAYRERRRAGMSDEAIAAAVGKPLEHVRGLLAAATLPPFGLAAMDRGELAPSIAALIGRIPGEADREKATACVLLGQWPGQLDAEDLDELRKGTHPDKVDEYRETLTFRDVRDLIAKFQVSLQGAPFRKALDLIDGVPTCDECPKRAGNAAQVDESYKSLRADTCLDPSCFTEKQQAWGRLAVAKAEKAGKTVLAGDAAKKVFDSYSPDRLPWNSPYIDLGDKCHLDDKGRTYAALLKGKATPVTAVDPRTGKAHELILRTDAAPVLKAEHGIELGTSGRASSSESEKKERAAAKRKQEVGRAAAHMALAQVAARMERAILQGADLSVKQVQSLLCAMADAMGADVCHIVTKRRNLEAKGNADGYRKPVMDLITTLDTAGLAGLAGELLAAKKAYHWGHPYFGTIDKAEKEWWSAWDIDPAALMKDAAEERKEEKQAKGKKPVEPPATVGAPRPEPSADLASWREVLPPESRPLELVNGLNPNVARDLAKKGVKTLADVVRLVKEQRDQIEGLELNAALFGGLSTVLTRGHAGGAADVLLDHVRPLVADLSDLDEEADDEDKPDTTLLSRIPGFRSEDAKLLESLALRTIADVEARMEKASEGRDGESLGLPELLYQTFKGMLGWKRESIMPMVDPIVAYLTLGGEEPEQACRVCGCTEGDCSQCIAASGKPCYWVKRDLCSRCDSEAKAKPKAEARAAVDALNAVPDRDRIQTEAIELLGVKATELQKASVLSKWSGQKLAANPVEVTPFWILATPYVVTCSVTMTPPGLGGKSTIWYCVPLLTRFDFTQKYPDVTIRTDPRDTSGGLVSVAMGGSHLGTAVTVNGRDYIIGDEERKLMEAVSKSRRS